MTAPAADTVTILDPTHPFAGLTLPLLGLATTRHLGRVCIVELYPGVERRVPLAATSLAAVRLPPSPCRLSVLAITQFLTAVASLPNAVFGAEDAHAPDAVSVGLTPSAAQAPSHRRPAGAVSDALARAGLADPAPSAPGPDSANRAPRRAGGAP